MKIKLTPEQEAEFIKDKYIDVQLGDNYRFYLELDRDEAPFYFEVVQSEKNKTVHRYAYNFDELILCDVLFFKRLDEPVLIIRMNLLTGIADNIFIEVLAGSSFYKLFYSTFN